MRAKWFLPAALLLLAVSCTVKESEQAAMMTDAPKITATFGSNGPSTKVSVTESDGQSRQTFWEKGDEIAVFFHSTRSVEYALEGDGGEPTGVFSYAGGAGGGLEFPGIFGVYPYDRDAAFDGSMFTLTFPAEQNYREGAFDAKANLMVAASKTNELFFRNVGGYLVLKLYGEDVAVSKVVVSGNCSEPLAGPAYVWVDEDDAPYTEMDVEGETEVAVVCAEPVTVGATAAEGTEFWFVLPPTEFEEGLTVTVYGGEGEVFTRSAEVEMSISRNEVYRLETEVVFEQPVVYTVPYVEDFEDNFVEERMQDWTFIDADGDDFNWEISDRSLGESSCQPHSGYVVLYSASYDNASGELYPDNWAITPAITLSEVSNYLSFWVAPQDPSWIKEHYAVYITTAEEPTSDPDDYVCLLEKTITSTMYVQQVIELDSEYLGKTVHIAFRHFDCSDWFMINLDDVMITEDNPNSNDDPDPDIIFSEDCEGDLDGWMFIDADGDDDCWYLNGDEDGGNNWFASDSYYYDVLDPDNWLISPAIELSATSNFLSFWVGVGDLEYYMDHYAVCLVTDQNFEGADNIDDLEITTLFEETFDDTTPAESTSDGEWHRFIVEIPSTFNGVTVRLVFRHYDTDGFFGTSVFFDDIVITETEPVVSSPSPSPAKPGAFARKNVAPKQGVRVNGRLVRPEGMRIPLPSWK